MARFEGKFNKEMEFQMSAGFVNGEPMERQYGTEHPLMDLYRGHHAKVMEAADKAFDEYPLISTGSRWLRDQVVGMALVNAEAALGKFVSLSNDEVTARNNEWDNYGDASDDCDLEAAKQNLDCILRLYLVKIERMEA